jgi:hypothetical protein
MFRIIKHTGTRIVEGAPGFLKPHAVLSPIAFFFRSSQSN